MNRLFLSLFATLALLACLTDGGGGEEMPGTFSLVGFDPATGELGVAVQSRAFSVGSAVPWAEAGVGAIATQAQTNESFGPLGLEKLKAGLSPDEVLDQLLGADPQRQHRQIGIVDAQGRSAGFTGPECLEWAGDTSGFGFAAQGNILANKDVLHEMVRAFHQTEGELAERLISSLHTAQAAGGDRRGQQSAALLVVRPSEKFPEYRERYIDLRVEDHPLPIHELERVFRIHQTQDLLRARVRYIALYDSLGDADAAQRERERIGATLKRALADARRDAHVLNGLAWYCAMGDVYLEEALQAAKLAAEMEPADTAILDTLAEVYFRLGRHDDARAVVERGLLIAPEDPYLSAQKKRLDQLNE
jgi:uncharacterized Ntn-hydrolase superfamily protein